MKIAVTGGAGYLGSVLVPLLIEQGHEIRLFDHAYFGRDHILYSPKIDFIQEDIRSFANRPSLIDRLLDRCDCIIHLAAISNDPSAELSPVLTNQVNFLGTSILAQAAKERGIKFIFSSSCSIYGHNEEGHEIDEDGALLPLTAYAESKVKAEKTLMDLRSRDWNPVILRNGTLFGYSPRMRFDLVVNIFSMYSALYNEIKIFSGGHQWRPFLHVADCARAFCFFAAKKDCKYTVYNIAYQNRSVTDLIAIFRELNPNLKVTYTNNEQTDRRDYRVTTQRMKEEGFLPVVDIPIGAKEIIEAIKSGKIKYPEANFYNNVKWMKELMLCGRLCLKSY